MGPKGPKKEIETDATSLYTPCVNCKKPRTLCIRVRRPIWRDFGHAALSLHEEGQDKITYGNWPDEGKDNDVRKNYAGDDYEKDDRWKKEDVKCKELTEDEEKRLKEELAKKQAYDLKDNNCSKWAGGTWNRVTNDGLDWGQNTNWVYNSPATLADSMNPSAGSIPGGAP